MRIIGYAAAVFTTAGKVVGHCGHIHRTLRGAGRCLPRHSYAGHPTLGYWIRDPGDPEPWLAPATSRWRFTDDDEQD